MSAEQDSRPLYWSVSAQDPLFDELHRQELRLLAAARELERNEGPDEREQLRPAFEAVLTGVSLLVVLPALLALMMVLFG